MEAKLKEFRALRRRKLMIESAKQKLEYAKRNILNLFVPNIYSGMNRAKKEDEVLLLEDEQPTSSHLPPNYAESVDVASEVSELESFEEEKQESWRYFIIKWTLCTVTWITLYIFFLKAGFGAVFFVISLLIGICLNTRTRRKKAGEVSAYSVFNRNCESIDGTLKAEELEKQMLYGVGSVRMF